jgi:hypothetical protein
MHLHHLERRLLVTRIYLQEIHPVGHLADVKLLLVSVGLGHKSKFKYAKPFGITT